MDSEIVIRTFGEDNIADYELLTRDGNNNKVCYCSFWHQKWSSMDEYHNVQYNNPESLKHCVLDRMRSRFHVGVIAYIDNVPCAWVSVGPLIDFHWTWRRVAQIGENAKNVAGILCFTVAPEFRGQNMQQKVLMALKDYGRQKGWTSIEAYPFADAAIEKHGNMLMWTGHWKGYERSGFKKLGDHWLSNPEAPRYLYSWNLQE